MKHWILSAFLVLFLIEVFSVFPTRKLPEAPSNEPSFITGLINVHTHLSDGSEGIENLSALARES
ncbi:MAG: hypothetical protein ACKN9V_06690, partial [Pseudomonadota bacterium]